MTTPLTPRRTSPLRRGVALAQSRTRGGDDGFALIFALLLIFIVAALSVSLAGVVFNQVEPSQFAKKDIRTINGASAGLQVSLDQIRAANNGSGQGSLLKLPCTSGTGASFGTGTTSFTTSGSTYTGTVNSAAGNVSYQTSIAYYTSDPTSFTTGSGGQLQSKAMACPLLTVPAYAYIQTTGSAGAVPTLGANQGNRTVHAIYQFQTTDTNVAGGRLLEYGSSPSMCIDAGSSPGVGTTLTMQPCLALGTAQQTWQYRNDLSLFYGGNPTLNLCIQAAQTVGATPSLQTCTGNGSEATYPYSPLAQQLQEWGFNDTGHFAEVNATGDVSASGSGGQCLDPANVSNAQAPSGDALAIVSCDGNTTGFNAWSPDPQAGAGKAGGNTSGVPGSPTNQYVNYYEFGRCLDITGQDVNADHLIDYPCKQAPNSANLTFNQVWSFTTVSGQYGTMSVNYGGVPYCLTAQSSSVYILTQTCASPTTYQLWQATGLVAGNYAASYELINQANGQCMGAEQYSDGLSDPTPPYSNIITEACNGSLHEKWNAPANNPNSDVSNISESNPGG